MATKLVRNGDSDGYDVRWSVASRMTLWALGIIAAIIAAAILGSASLALDTVRKLDVIEARQVMILSHLQRIDAEIAAESYVTREEFFDWLRSDDRAHSVRAIVRGEKVK